MPNVITIEAKRGLVPLNLRELWEYRELVYFMLSRDVKGRYRQMALGPLWMVINPLLNMVFFTLIFSMVARLPSDGLPYPLFNYAALLPWTFFTGVLHTAASSLMSHRDIISKIYFPRLIIPLVGVGAALFDFLISFMILLGLMAWYGFYPTVAIVWLPVYLLLATCTGLAVGLWFAAWIAHFRDLSSVLGYIGRVWMYATPVVYASSMVPERWRLYYDLNPMTVVIEGCRWSLLQTGSGPDRSLLFAFALVAPFLVAGAYHFRRTERSIVDIA
jgi:lipopolysaccharide transport system permease protein